jgi:hypothetical protein
MPDRVDADAMAAVVDRQRFREADHGVLAAHVGGARLARMQPSCRVDLTIAPRRCSIIRGSAARAIRKGPSRLIPQLAHEILLAHIERGPQDGDAGVVDQDVHSAEGLYRGRDSSLAVVGARVVHLHRARHPTGGFDLGRHPLGRLTVEVGADDATAFAAEQVSDRASVAGARAGDGGGAALEPFQRELRRGLARTPFSTSVTRMSRTSSSGSRPSGSYQA